MKLRINSIFFFNLFIISFVSAQSNLEKANKQFELGSYNNAIKSYQKILEKDPVNQAAIVKLADCFRLTNKMYDAENWYRKAAQFPKVEPSVYLNYGKVLMANNEYEKAKGWFSKYDTTDKIISKHYIKHCEFALANKGLEPYFEVSNESFNSAAIEFGPVFYKNSLLFSSSRSDIKRAKKLNLEDFQGKYPNQYFKASLNEETKTPEFFRNDLTNVYNEGNLSIASDKSIVAFTRNSFVDGIRIPNQLENNGIFIGEIDNSGTIKNIEPFPFNGTSFSCVFPCLSADGSELYFSSNRPDGFGGFDIYVSKKSGRNWSAPQNLGSKINTAGNEISPYINNNKLYFASDFHLGFGGQDIFLAEKSEDGYKNITNMGTGVNSPYDDFNFCFDNKLNFGFFVSNRNFRNGEDIYRVVSQSKELKIIVLDADDRKPVDDAILDIKSPGLGKNKTDNFGQFQIQIPNNTILQLKVSKNGFQDKSLTLSNNDIKDNQIEILIKKNSTFNFGLVVEQNSKKPIEKVVVTAIGDTNGEKFQTETDGEGMYYFSLKEVETYKIKFSKAGYIEQTKTVKNIKPAELLGTEQLSFVNSQTSNLENIKNGGKEPKNTAKKQDASNEKNESVEAGEWAIQLKTAASTPNLAAFDKLKSFGNIYSLKEQKVEKIRLGDFDDKTKADKILLKVKQLGYSSAFITKGQSKTQIETKKVNENKATNLPKTETKPIVVAPKTEEKVTESESGDFYIRLVAVKDTKNIDEVKLNKIGKVVKEFNGKVYAIYVGNFSSANAASSKLIDCKKLGYKDAYVVKKVNGKFEKN